MRRFISLALSAFAACLALGDAHAQSTPAPQAPPQPPPNTCTSAPYRAEDFWLGKWDVYDRATNELVGHNSLTAHEEGCVVEEEWVGVDPHDSGRSLNMYDITTGKWLQFWMNATGDVSRFEGGPTPNGGMYVAAMNEMRPGGHRTFALNITLTPQPDGSVRQHGQYSLDNGVTWGERYDYIYRQHHD